ncbi:MAG: hypothetical protein FD147_1632 [Chloroflexi bacterium]|nr:MAG: hypothetical protein FD147_1632 [Chloroflexota bacterium]
MKILTIDVGTGTQDIFLYDSRLDIENGYKLVLPSPTMMVRQQILAATKAERDIVLTGVTMGGGPCGWAVNGHIASGFRTFATPDAARTVNDDLNMIKEMGVILVSEEEAGSLHNNVVRIELHDFDFQQIEKAFALFGVRLSDLDAVAVAVFDHGNAPADISDRKFRFEYLDQRIRAENRLSAFAYLSNQIPEIMTRLQAVADSAKDLRTPLVVMDTAPAAILGATYDPSFRDHNRVMIANIGNFHTLAFRLGPSGIEGVFEHHTGILDPIALDEYIYEFAQGTLTNDRVYSDHGHGALIYTQESLSMDHSDFNIIVTGPRRNMVKNSRFRPFFAVPFGDMMLSGCFGLLSAVADVLPNLAEPIYKSLNANKGHNTEPWQLD